jgi:hypothetical protein
MYLPRDVMSDVNLLVIEKHAIDRLDSTVCSLGGFVMNKAIALGASMFIGSDLARQHIAKGGESIVESLWCYYQSRHPHEYTSPVLTLLSICSSRFLIKMLP